MLDAVLDGLEVGGALGLELLQHLHVMVPPESRVNLSNIYTMALTFPCKCFRWSPPSLQRTSQWGRIQPTKVIGTFPATQHPTYRCRHKSKHGHWGIEIWVRSWVWPKPSAFTLWSPPLGLDKLRKNRILPRFRLVAGHLLDTLSAVQQEKQWFAHRCIDPTMDQLPLLYEPFEDIKKRISS